MKELKTILCFIFSIFVLSSCSEDPLVEEPNEYKSYKVSATVDVEKGILTKAEAALPPEYKNNTVFLIGQRADNGYWDNIECDIVAVEQKKVTFDFVVLTSLNPNKVKISNGLKEVEISEGNMLYYSSKAGDFIQISEKGEGNPTPGGEQTYRPYGDFLFKALHNEVKLCTKSGYPIFGKDTIKNDANNHLSVKLHRFTGVLSPRIVLTLNEEPVKRESGLPNSWSTIFGDEITPQDWTMVFYLEHYPIQFDLRNSKTELDPVGILDLFHDSPNIKFDYKEELIYRTNGDKFMAETFVALEEINDPYLFPFDEEHGVVLKILIYYKKGLPEEELRIASINIPRVNKNEKRILNLYMDANDILRAPIITTKSSSMDSSLEIPIRMLWED